MILYGNMCNLSHDIYFSNMCDVVNNLWSSDNLEKMRRRRELQKKPVGSVKS